MTQPLPGDIFQSGQVLNNTYEIEEVLGRGGTGEAYRARNQITGRVVAVKALNRAMSVNDAYVELMRREEEMRAITSDAVVRYTDCARSDEGHVYLVMDYVDGTPLSAWLERGGADPADILTVARRVAEGLVATHARNIVHRDLSPDNIILRRDDPAQAVIIDFGIAKDTNVGARTIVGETFAGKYEYAAPEQLHGRADARSDLYALGAVMLATFRGAVPDVGRNPGEIMRRKQEPLDVGGVPEPLRSLIVELTNPDPAHRLPSAEALVREIDRLRAARVTPLTGPAKRRRLWPWLLPAAALAGLAGAWGLGVIGGGQPAAEPDTLVLEVPPATEADPPPAIAPPAAKPEPEPQPAPPTPPAPVPADAPAPLPSAAQLREAASRHADCGPIEIATGPEQDVSVTGRVSGEAVAETIRTALSPLLGDRRLRDRIEILNAPICAVLRVLPVTTDISPIGIILGYQDRPDPNPAGIYHDGDQPLISLEIPSAGADGHLWVTLVDVSGDLVNLFPTSNLPDSAIAAYAPAGQESRVLPLTINLTVSQPYGASMLLAIQSDRPLFPSGRETLETAESFAAALATAVREGVTIESVAETLIATKGKLP